MRSLTSLVCLTLVAAGACTAGTSDSGLFDEGTAGGGGQTASTTVAEVASSVETTGFLTTITASSSASGAIICDSLPTDDADMDGFTGEQGDCNDCDANVNPRAIEVIVTEPDDMGNIPAPADEDCDMQIDNLPPPCDMGLMLGATSPLDAAKAIDLCKGAQGDDDWGLIDTKLVRADGSMAQSSSQYGVMPAFGAVQARGGSSLLAMATGTARTPGQPDACNDISCNHAPGVAPQGFPSPVPNCPGAADIEDDVGLEVRVRAPSNATGYKFDFKFHSFEFAEYVCTEYNDQFFVKADPPPMGAAPNGNITFDANNNPVSVNVAFFDVCSPSSISDFAIYCDDFFDPNTICPQPPNPYCPLGAAELAGTGFDSWGDAGATSWLQTQAPIDPYGEVTLRFAIFDTGDANYDSTVLVDNFQWIANGGTIAVGTDPVPQ